jgi:hypothetical protein
VCTDVSVCGPQGVVPTLGPSGPNENSGRSVFRGRPPGEAEHTNVSGLRRPQSMVLSNNKKPRREARLSEGIRTMTVLAHRRWRCNQRTPSVPRKCRVSIKSLSYKDNLA